MQALLRRKVSGPLATCFFCNTTLDPQPPDRTNFTCPYCDCRNRYDSRGRITSDEPAMHEDHLNHKSYTRRASPSKGAIPSLTSTNHFCRTCQTNQALQMNLLANYLPPSTDPTHKQLLDQLPAYKESLNLRYPPICSACAPVVEQDIERKNQMTRAATLGGWLRQSKQQAEAKRRRAAEEAKRTLIQHWKARWQTSTFPAIRWRIQGLLWATTALASVSFNVAASGLLSQYRSPFVIRQPVVLAAFCLISIVWTTWDPTWNRIRKAASDGQELRFPRKAAWIVCQRLLWLSRIAEIGAIYIHTGTVPEAVAKSFLVVETLLLIISLLSVQVKLVQKARISLSGSRTVSLSSAPDAANDLDPLGSLSLSNQPPLPRSSSLPARSSRNILQPPAQDHPTASRPHDRAVFGQTTFPSVHSFQHSLFGPSSNPEEQMEWDPTPSRLPSDEDWLKPQTFFPREEPTGLEGIFSSNWLDDDGSSTTSGSTWRSKNEALRRDPRTGLSSVLGWFGKK